MSALCYAVRCDWTRVAWVLPGVASRIFSKLSRFCLYCHEGILVSLTLVSSSKVQELECCQRYDLSGTVNVPHYNWFISLAPTGWDIHLWLMMYVAYLSGNTIWYHCDCLLGFSFPPDHVSGLLIGIKKNIIVWIGMSHGKFDLQRIR